MEVSSLLSLEVDGLARPTNIRAMVAGDTLASGIIPSGINRAASGVNVSSTLWNTVYNQVQASAGYWNVAAGVADLSYISGVINSVSATAANSSSILNASSGIWNETYETVLANSATWGGISDASSLRGSPLSATLVPSAGQSLVYDGSVWTASTVVATGGGGGGGVTDHGALTGLADDDHPQYVLSATNNALSSLVNNHIASAVHWDIATLNNNYINASGDSANAAFFFQTLSATTVSATTYLNLPSSIATWNASALQGKTLNAAAPTINDILRYNGTQWINDSETQYSLNGELGAGWTINAASGINFTNTATNTFRITANYTSGIWNASALQGSPLSATLVPTAGQALMYNGSVWTASAALFAYTYGSGAPTGGSDGDIYLQTDVEALQVATVSSTNLLTTSGDVSAVRLTDYSERKSAPTISSSSLTLDLNAAQVFTVSLNSNISTLTISNTESRANSVQGFTLILTADGTARTITWPGSVKWPSGTGPTLTSTNNKVDILSFVSPDNGTTWYGFIGGQNY